MIMRMCVFGLFIFLHESRTCDHFWYPGTTKIDDELAALRRQLPNSHEAVGQLPPVRIPQPSAAERLAMDAEYERLRRELGRK